MNVKVSPIEVPIGAVVQASLTAGFYRLGRTATSDQRHPQKPSNHEAPRAPIRAHIMAMDTLPTTHMGHCCS